ncbi:uncharacterized protein Dvar_15340 [Desulfosarcina variabilis str. Montpellier]|uniref:hypothetical protein n=1 Tax=Desulfosarcina variabilis TaxID=2300 RepID=UPI003AFA3E7E
MKWPNLCFIGMLSIFLIGLSGCAKNVALKKTLWEKPDAKVGIAIETLPELHTQQKGGGLGLLEVGINALVNSTLRDHLKETSCDSFSGIKKKFAGRIKAGGLEPIIIDDYIDVKSLPEVENKQEGKSDIDVSSLAEKYDVDYLLMLKIKSVGTTRNYFFVIPVGAPKAYCVAGGKLIEGKTNEEYWAYTMKQDEVKVDIEGEWDNPPDYPELDAAIEKAIAQAVAQVESNFN